MARRPQPARHIDPSSATTGGLVLCSGLATVEQAAQYRPSAVFHCSLTLTLTHHSPMPVPRIAIVGRPNVGKSSLFNWLVRRRVSVVDPTAGVTRDRVTFVMQAGDRYVELVDTGGIGLYDTDQLEEQIEHPRPGAPGTLGAKGH